MDFFAHQDRARRRTGGLLLGFCLGVLALVVAVGAAAWGIASLLRHGDGMLPLGQATPYLVLSTLAVVLLVTLGSAAKTHALAAAGGAGIAEGIGGRRVPQGTSDPARRQLLNVVEEMAIASGLPVPAVYVLEQETSINAFAAGLTHGDAVVAVTRGALDRLTREELQGVVAHEFSHVLNGDMRLNVRLIGLLHGILLLAVTGRIIVQSLRHVRVKRGKGGGVVGAILLIGVALWILGWVGWAAGRILQAAVSRQREFLADASAVQFTRNPGGLAGALRKLLAHGTRVRDVRSGELGHLFFGNARRRQPWLAFLATHPSLEARLDALEPGWRDRPLREARPAPAAAAAPEAPAPAGAAGFVARVGRPTATDLGRGGTIRASLPSHLAEAAGDAFSARALVLAALAEPAEAGGRALADLRAQGKPQLAHEALRLHAAVAGLPREQALAAVLLAIPTLRGMSAAQRLSFVGTLEAFARGDGVVTLRERALHELVAFHLGVVPRPSRRPRAAELREAERVLLGILARADARDEAVARRAYAAAGAAYGEIPSAAVTAGGALRDGLAACRQAPFAERKALVEAAARVVASDGRVHPDEADVLRLVCDALGCPVPPLAPA